MIVILVNGISVIMSVYPIYDLFGFPLLYPDIINVVCRRLLSER